MVYIIFLVGIAFNASASYTLKLLANGSKHLLTLATLKNPLLYLAIFLFGMNVVFYMLLLQRVNLAIGYPIFVGGTFALVLLFSLLFLRENINLLQILGIVLIFGGILLAIR